MTPDKQENRETSAEYPTTEVHPFRPGEAGSAGETLPDVPAMEQLPQPGALPDPGYPEMPEAAESPAADFAPEPGPAPGTWPGAGPVPGRAVSAVGGLAPAGTPTPPDGLAPADGPGSQAWPHPPAWPDAPSGFAAPAAPAARSPQSDWPAKAAWSGQPVPSFRPGQPTAPQPVPAQPEPAPGPDPLGAAPRTRVEPAPPAPPAGGPGPAVGPEPSWTDEDQDYAAEREPDEAPPLRGPAVPWDEVRAAADRDEAAEPLAAPPTLQAPPGSGYPGPGLTYADPALRPADPVPPQAGRISRPGGPLPPVPGGEPPAPRFAGLPPAPVPVAEPAEEDEQRPTSDALTSDALLRGKRATPDGGWRQTIFRATGGLVRVGESSSSLRRRDLVNRIRTPVAGGHYRVAVLSLKGGVGKTTATVGLGATLASLRGDRVIAVDGNPDRGTLSDKVVLETSATIRDLLNQRALVGRYADVRAFTSQASSRLEILASDRDPGVSVAFSADDYRAVAAVLEHYYSICITDCGTGLLHSAMAGILELADQIVLVSSPSVDGARSASATLDWLEAHGYGDLVRDGVVVLSAVRRKSRSGVDLDRLEQHFAARCRAVVRVPYDTHLEEGAEFELGFLDSETAEAYLTLAALVADGFPRPRHLIASGALGSPLA